ncbi:hydrolase CocE/NonD family protein [Lysobacter antibioticus]|uniref:Hydrolase CocE/NonD family protein n=2 Tax=Lysobacter antibioticus TaxID=84531 RepID=A0A0S2FCY7_LYSAN|nr:hydrolase CocE/NonD family protein [Lysobacter antibioticus]
MLLSAPCFAADPPIELPAAALESPAALDAAMPALAERLIGDYREPDRARYLTQLFRLQLVAGRYAEARRSIEALRALTPLGGPPQQRATLVQYEIHALAKERQARERSDFDSAFRASFEAVFANLNDRSAALAMRGFTSDQFAPATLQRALDTALAAQRGKQGIDSAAALALLRAYHIAAVYRDFSGQLAGLVARDDARRYRIDREVQVRTPAGATVCTLVVRPRSAEQRLPTLLNFTIYANPATMLNEARRTASNGYAGVVGLSRGKGCSPDIPVPYEHDGRDAAALIDWIAKQPWSDGRVGMYGGSYEGFTQWATAKRRPKALKALMPSVTGAPGIDVPKEGGIYFGFQHYWPFYVANNKTLDQAPYEDDARWRRMYRQWYLDGSAYRERDRIDGTRNPLYRRWLDHPDYDAYWQDMIPYRDEFAMIDIPVLTTTGYYDGAQIGALYYLQQHYKYRPQAEHYLVIGPYDHVGGQRGTAVMGDNLRGYAIDPVARIDMGELRYQWFDHVFKQAPKPAVLKDRINYQVMGANVWKHAPSLQAMGERRLRLHFAKQGEDGRGRLVPEAQGGDSVALQRVDLADRRDADRWVPGGGIVDRVLDAEGSLVFVSEPFAEAVEFSGLFGGHLDLMTNKRDLDLHIGLYELNAKGEYFELSRFQSRLSYLQQLEQRRLLTPGRRERFDFSSGRLTSRRFEPGSRLLALICPGKGPQDQINYGSGKDVSDETLADAGEALRIEWFGGSYLEIPLSR